MRNKYEVQVMKKNEVRTIALDWAAKEGWNPGLYDLDSFYSTDPNGFYVGLLDGHPIACISAVAYDAKFGFVGFYIVKPEYRGKGYGLKLWKEALKHIATQNIGLDGVVDQQENYKKSGFKLAYRNIRYEGRSKKYKTSSSEIIPLNKVKFEKISKFDIQIFPTSRAVFLKNWITQPESYAVGSCANDNLNGYAVIRKCLNGYKIGPLFAESEKIAIDLFEHLNNFLEPGTIFYLDVPEKNAAAIKLAQNHNMKYVFETARMYNKREPTVDLNKIFGVTSFELG